MASRNTHKALKRGWTTGACATAAAAAAFRAVLTGSFEPWVTIKLPNGQTPQFKLSTNELGKNWAKAGVIKDAGDDPDVTHGTEIITTITFSKTNTGIIFRAGEGIGTVTLPGLPLSVGEPAINPKPRAMISDAINQIANEFGVPSNIIVTISIPGGELLAKNTMNSRLGVIGGLSVLGTTGIVIPYSCASWINSIHRGIDVAKAAKLSHIVAATGSNSEASAKKTLNIPEQALIDMGDFVGGMLKYLRKHPVKHLTIVGGFGKLTKLAQGNLDLHSSRSQLDMKALANTVQELGGTEVLIKAIEKANSGLEGFNLCKSENLKIGDIIAKRAKEVVLASLSGHTNVSVLIFDRDGSLVGQSNE